MVNFKEEKSEEASIHWEEKLQSLLNQLNPYMLQIWEKRKQWLISNGIGAVIILLYMLFIVKPYYEVTIYILPDYGSKISSMGGLGDLASMAGVSLKAAPTEIYENIVQSESVLMPVFLNKYKTEKFKDSINLLDYFEILPDKDFPPALQERGRSLKVLKLFHKTLLKTKIDWTTKILTVSITMPESKLSAEVANQIVESLDRYIRTQRKSYASDQRVYLEKRINEVSDSLTISEEKLRIFRERNTSSINIPRLALEENRLSRSVTLLQSVYMDLTRQLELTKLDEIKDTPVLNIQELANDPIVKTGPPRTIWSIFLMCLYTTFITVLFIFLPKLKKVWHILEEWYCSFRRS